MKKELLEVIKLVEMLGGKLDDVRQDSSGVNVYVFTIRGSEVEVSARCLKTFLKVLKQVINDKEEV